MLMLVSRREAVAGAAGLLAPPTAEPRRIVSMNPCLDAVLIQLADRAQIAAVSHYTHDPQTTSAGAAGLTLPYTHETAEEIIALRPDLVLAARHSAAATRAALDRLHIRTEQFSLVNSVEESLAQITRMAALVHRPQRGVELIARIKAAVAEAAPPPGAPRLSALVFQASGFVAAGGTLMDELLRESGFDNAAARYGLRRTGNLRLEQVLADPPDVLLAGSPKPAAPNWADRVLVHPALASVAHRMYRASFPQRLTFCGGPVIIEACAVLAKAHRDALEHRMSKDRA
jgi:iron complex transport system substrate-binding protein